MNKIAFVVARHTENIAWMSYLTRKSNYDVFLYNDGPTIPKLFTKNMTIYTHEKSKHEAGKYLDFIVKHYSILSTYEKIIFTQANPFDHSPDFIGILENINKFKTPFQGLTYVGHPEDTWGNIKNMIDEKYTHEFIENNRLWCDKMTNELQGTEFIDKWLNKARSKHCMITVKEFWNKYDIKYEIPELKKWFGACFAVTPYAIFKHDIDLWKILYEDFKGEKSKGIKIEYMWQALFSCK
jgi:hypothetical protein